MSRGIKTLPAYSPTKDVITIELLEQHLDEEVPCDGQKNGTCTAAAVWVYRHDCGAIWLGCDPHRRWADLHVATWTEARCRQCDQLMPKTLNWRPL